MTRRTKIVSRSEEIIYLSMTLWYALNTPEIFRDFQKIRKMIALNDPKEVKHYSSQVGALLKCIKGERTALGLPNHICQCWY